LTWPAGRAHYLLVMSLGQGILLTVLGSLLMSCSWILQKSAVVRMPRLEMTGPRAGLRSLLASRTWVAGILLLLGGFGLFQFALVQTGEVSVLQPMGAAGLVFLALVAVLFLKERLSPGEWVSLLALVGGIILLGTTAESHPRAFSGRALLAVLLVAGGLGWGMTVARQWVARLVPPESLAGAIGGVIQGLGLLFMAAFGHFGKAGHVVGGSLFLVAAMACYTLNLLILQRGLQEGRATVVITINTAATNVVAIAGGMVVLGEHLPQSDTLAALQVGAFAVVVLASIPLARLGAVAPAPVDLQPPVGG
jgi:drug/metabolite transporter (DMT)-like permease